MDRLTPEKRSWNMSRIKSKDTTPERIVRSFLHRNGFRFRLHVKDLPGKPDIVLPKYKLIIDIRGCFWHAHSNCKYAKIPTTNSEWWENKLKQNQKRDEQNIKALLNESWKVLVIWDCLFKKGKSCNILRVGQGIVNNVKFFVNSQDVYQEIYFEEQLIYSNPSSMTMKEEL